MFIIAAVVAIVSALRVVLGRNLFHACMFLGLFLLFISAFYFLLGADLVGIMQVFVYVGGVVVVLLFGIMLTAQITDIRLVSGIEQRIFTLLSVAALVALIAGVALKAKFPAPVGTPPKDSLAFTGKLFMTNYILPFEIISILLLAALIGAVIVARQEGKV